MSSISPELRELVANTVNNHIQQNRGKNIKHLYNYVLELVEPSLLEAIMNYTHNNNQSLAAEYLGLSRGTTRKKLKQYFGEKYCSYREKQAEEV